MDDERRACGRALAAPRFALRAYLQERTADGAQSDEVAGVGAFSHYVDAVRCDCLGLVSGSVGCDGFYNVAINSAEDTLGGVMRMR